MQTARSGCGRLVSWADCPLSRFRRCRSAAPSAYRQVELAHQPIGERLLPQPHQPDRQSAPGQLDPGAGGCFGFADPQARLGFGYVANRMGSSIAIDERAQALIEAAYAC